MAQGSLGMDAGVAGGAARRSETLEQRLARKPLLALDTQTIVGSVLLAVAFSATMQITERIDQATTGGMAVWLGYTFANLWWPVTVILFGLTGALITANFNPIIAVLTATHPLAWSFFFLNMAWTVPFALLTKYHMRSGRELTLKWFWLYSAIANTISILGFIFGIYLTVLKVPVNVWFPFAAWMWLMGVIPGTLMGWYLYRRVVAAGIFE